MSQYEDDDRTLEEIMLDDQTKAEIEAILPGVPLEEVDPADVSGARRRAKEILA